MAHLIMALLLFIAVLYGGADADGPVLSPTPAPWLSITRLPTPVPNSPAPSGSSPWPIPVPTSGAPMSVPPALAPSEASYPPMSAPSPSVPIDPFPPSPDTGSALSPTPAPCFSIPWLPTPSPNSPTPSGPYPWPIPGPTSGAPMLVSPAEAPSEASHPPMSAPSPYVPIDPFPPSPDTGSALTPTLAPCFSVPWLPTPFPNSPAPSRPYPWPIPGPTSGAPMSVSPAEAPSEASHPPMSATSPYVPIDPFPPSPNTVPALSPTLAPCFSIPWLPTPFLNSPAPSGPYPWPIPGPTSGAPMSVSPAEATSEASHPPMRATSPYVPIDPFPPSPDTVPTLSPTLAPCFSIPWLPTPSPNSPAPSGPYPLPIPGPTSGAPMSVPPAPAPSEASHPPMSAPSTPMPIDPFPFPPSPASSPALSPTPSPWFSTPSLPTLSPNSPVPSGPCPSSSSGPTSGAPMSVPLAPAPSPSMPITFPPFPAPHRRRSVKAAYWPSYRSSAFSASAIDTSYFTHVYYAFLLPDQTSYELVITQPDDQMLPDFTATLHSKRPPAKALLSIGGGGNNATTFALMVSNASSRAVFINSTIAVARKYGLDGLDLDWEFPQSQEEMDNLGVLFAEWRAALRKEAKVTGHRRLLLTAAVYFAANFFLSDVNQTYPIGSIRRNLDWVSPMCFDYHGSWDTSVTGAHAALYDPNGSDLSTSYGITSWINAGVPPRKVVMGLPLYGRTWQLKDPSVNGIGAPAVGVGPGDDGIIVYSDLVDYNVQNNATVVYDGATVSAYSYAGTSWIGYDDATSVTRKIKYAQRQKNIRGYFFWALGFDKDWTISKQASDSWVNW